MSFEASFADALLDPERPLPPDISAPHTAIPARRYAVYRNNVMAGLSAVLQRRFPVVDRLVGHEFFIAMTREFIKQQPPRSPLLATYGDEFAGFIAAFAPARDLPYLADVAKLEAARTRAYHAEDAMPLQADAFASLDSNGLAELCIDLHPSVEIVRSQYPIVTIWAMNSGELPLCPIADFCGEDALVVRPHLDVEIRVLPPGGAAFLLALAAGFPLGEAAEAGLADHAGFDLAGNLAGLIGSGVARGIVASKARTSCPH
jgi:hypothetical protein